MNYTIPITKDMVTARSTLRISNLSAIKVCRALNRKKFKEAKEMIEKVSNEEVPLNRKRSGKFYTKTSVEILKFLKALEANAINRGFTPDDMILYISAHKGSKLMRRRRKRKFGLMIKVSQVQGVLKKEEKVAKK